MFVGCTPDTCSWAPYWIGARPSVFADLMLLMRIQPKAGSTLETGVFSESPQSTSLKIVLVRVALRFFSCLLDAPFRISVL